MKPLVSILVPVYGVENYIEKCCRSLFEQTYDNIEYVFVDDCTKDNSIIILEDLLNDYPTRKKNVKIVRHTQNKGLSGARNTAIDNSTGEYLMHVDSDDYLDLNVVECLVNVANEKDSDIVVYDMKYVYDNRSSVISQSINPDPKEYLKQLLTYMVTICVCGKLYKSSLFKDNNIRFIEGLNFGEDYVTSPRVSYYAKRIAHCEKCYYNYVQYNNSSYTNSYKSKNVDDLISAIQVLSDFFKEQQDYSFYANALDKAMLLNKIKLLIAICLNTRSVGYRLQEVCDLYNDLDVNSFTEIPLNYKIILSMSKKRQFRALKIYILLGFKLKQTIRNILKP